MPYDESKLYLDLVNDICGKEYPDYYNLIVFVHNLLSKKVEKWCYNDSFLRGGLHNEDIMQEIQIRIIKKCEDYFFKPVNGKTDKTCEEFKAWCTRVAKNYFISYCVKQKNRKEVELDLSIKFDEPGSSKDDSFTEHEKKDADRKDLQDCFEIVFDLKSSPHIILTWLSVSLFMVEYDLSRIKSTHIIVKYFSELTLRQMFIIVIDLITKIDWLQIDNEKAEKQALKLEKINKDTGKITGDMKYSDFYMSKGPEMSVSDWVNRINSQIKKRRNVD